MNNLKGSCTSEVEVPWLVLHCSAIIELVGTDIFTLMSVVTYYCCLRQSK